MMVARFGSGIWMPCLSTGPNKDGSSSSLMNRKTTDLSRKKKKNLILDCLDEYICDGLRRVKKAANSPSGGSDMGGLRQYMWYPLSQSSQNRSWSWKKKNTHEEVSSVKPPLQRRLWSTHVVLRGSAHVAALALYALPAVGLHRRHHDGRELQTGRVACARRQGRFSATKICNLFILYWASGTTHLSARSRSRTPALLIGRSCGWFWSRPSRSRSNCWVTRAHPDLSLELQIEVWRQICV